MMSPRKKRRIQLIVLGFALLIAATGLIIVGIGEGGQFFRSPTDIAAAAPRDGEVFRLGGLVKEGSWERDGERHAFLVTDTELDFPVSFVGIVPDLFREGTGTIVTGQIVDGVFIATEVLARHDETYMPAEVVDVLKEKGVYQAETGS
ncbi:MAG: cytochrome c maturation protein CcmE [Pseudomonadota bacterium]